MFGSSTTKQPYKDICAGLALFLEAENTKMINKQNKEETVTEVQEDVKDMNEIEIENAEESEVEEKMKMVEKRITKVINSSFKVVQNTIHSIKYLLHTAKLFAFVFIGFQL